ncbi:aldehyde dehydrogenase family protein [Paenibacillus favisporus]|uniref:aldehyde dehydrogenase family protein n=1 Tax=Paenibacillus TaxID=44249 RepID=UPI00190D6E26|nr:MULTISPECIES: aldehyde dehydrogenase family protein [Paenibacillus]MBJ9987725.1 aldehyde dehydrogenase family protein [Paenibacillus sp. S28]MEC0176659.1 aldehyde dehydrogenase family protein [Paenibacillus favisporus]
MVHSRNWIGGEWFTPASDELAVKNPSNIHEEIGVLHLSDASHIAQAEQAARAAYRSWSRLTGAARGEQLYRMAAALESASADVACLASMEMGKPITEMQGEVIRGVNLLRYYAAEGVRSNGVVIPASEPNVLQHTKKVPLGVVGVITPWNFPVAIPLWKIAPALICGNTVVWKPAENASLTATLLCEVFAAAALPPGVLNLVVGKGSRIGDALLEQISLDAVSFTGSTATGTRIAQMCAKRNIKYQTEMGGKNAAVILNDADLEKTVPMIVSGAYRSAGQKCTATSRIIIESGIYDAFIEAMKKAIDGIKLAPSLDPSAYLGPVASASQYETVMSYVKLARDQAEIVAEGRSAEANEEGYYIPPIAAAGVDPGHPLIQEEIFGPVTAMMKAADFDEAIALCNQSIYGLSASLFTRDLSYAHRFLDEAQAGMVRVNQETAGVEYQSPFGGLKLSSSHSREQGQAALDFYTELKTCAIRYW